MLIFVLLGLALLAGWGLDDLSGRAAPGSLRRGRLALAAAAGIFLVPVLWMIVAGTLDLRGLKTALRWPGDSRPAAGRPSYPDAAVGHDRPDERAAPVAAAGGRRLRSCRRWGGGRRPLAGCLRGARGLLLVVDLFRANMGFNPAIPPTTRPPPATGAIRYLQSQCPTASSAVRRRSSFQPLPPDLAMRFGLYDARGYDSPRRSATTSCGGPRGAGRARLHAARPCARRPRRRRCAR